MSNDYSAVEAAMASMKERGAWPKEDDGPRMDVYGYFYQSAEDLGTLYRIVHTSKWVTATASHPFLQDCEKGGPIWDGTSSMKFEDKDGLVAAREGDWVSWQNKEDGNAYNFEAEADPDHNGYYFLKLAGKWLCMNKDHELNVKGSGWYVLVRGPE